MWKICSNLNVDVHESIMVGDTISDIHAGINAKFGKVVGVLSGGYNSNELDNADIIINSINDLPNLINYNSKVINKN